MTADSLAIFSFNHREIQPYFHHSNITTRELFRYLNSANTPAANYRKPQISSSTMFLSTLSTLLLLLSASGSIAARSSGCGSPLPTGLSPGHTKPFRITSGGRTRTYRLYVPTNYNVNTAAPLILSYHGRTRNAKDQERISEFSMKKWNPNFVVAYPNGVKVHTNPLPLLSTKQTPLTYP